MIRRPLRPSYPGASRETRKVLGNVSKVNDSLRERTGAGGVDRTMKVRDLRGSGRIQEKDYVIRQWDTSAVTTLRLPDASKVRGHRYIIEDASGGAAANNITVASIGGQMIDGSATASIVSNYGKLTVRSDGRNWIME